MTSSFTVFCSQFLPSPKPLIVVSILDVIILATPITNSRFLKSAHKPSRCCRSCLFVIIIKLINVLELTIDALEYMKSLSGLQIEPRQIGLENIGREEHSSRVRLEIGRPSRRCQPADNQKRDQHSFNS